MDCPRRKSIRSIALDAFRINRRARATPSRAVVEELDPVSSAIHGLHGMSSS
jgi:hypothetical protein